MYTIERLERINFEGKGSITQEMTDWVNHLVRLIEETRSSERPQIGDSLEYTDRFGTWNPDAHIESISENNATVCEQSYIPFIMGEPLRFLTGGGPWCYLPADRFSYVGKRKKLFTIFMDLFFEPRSLMFEAEVNVWRYQEPNPMHGSYSTERWARQYVYHHVDKFGNPVGDSWYRYFGQDQAWKTDEDYAAWKRTYKAVVFKGATEDHEIVFYYREKLHVISKEEYQALQLPVDTRRMNGDIVIVKVAYDDEDHIVNTYSYAGEIRPGIISGQTHKDLLWNGESIEDMNRDYVGKIGGVNRDDQ